MIVVASVVQHRYERGELSLLLLSALTRARTSKAHRSLAIERDGPLISCGPRD
jgi:hypothetical protein